MQWVDNIITHLENYNEHERGSVVLFIENLSVNICKFKKDFILRGGGAGERAIVLKYNPDLEGCQGAQRICFETGQKCFMYAFLMSAFEPLARDASKKNLEYWAVHGKVGSDFSPVDFTCLERKFPVTLRFFNIFEKANAHLNIGVTVVQYETEFADGARSNKKGCCSQ
jgi:hypothetical protein